MKRGILIGYLFLLLFCFSCKEKPAEKITRPVKITEIGGTLQFGKTFPGFAEAKQYAYLTFRTGGMIQDFDVEEGQNVKEGQIIARLDPRDYNLKISAAKAAYEQSRSQMERYKRLYDKEAVSKQDYEIAQAKYENDKSVYNRAVNDLNDTRLPAPFAGNIEEKYVENHREVRPGERIVKIVNSSEIQFRIVIPENNLKNVSRALKCSIELDTERGKYYRAKVSEIVTSSVEGAGIPVILTIDDPTFNSRKTIVLPGFSCLVKIEFADSRSNDNAIEIPLSSIYSDTKTGKSAVWKVDKSTSTVRSVPVVTGNLSGDNGILVLSGLEKGDNIVTAGVNHLSEGETVKIIAP